MIRVAILAESAEQAEHLAELLATEPTVEITEARAIAGENDEQAAGIPDVSLIAGLTPHAMPTTSSRSVVLSDGSPSDGQLGHSVRAWLPLESSIREIVAAIHAVANDLIVLTSAQIERWLHPEPLEPAGTFIEALTPRELQVLRMLAEGLGNKEIAAQLGVSDHTAKFHVSQILAKLNAASRTEAVAIGIRRGLVPI